MDGLHCREVQYKNVVFSTSYLRLEADYFLSEAVNYDSKIKGCDVAERIQYGTSKYCNEDNSGYPVLRLNELDGCFIETPQKYCHILSDEEFEELKLKKDDVLIIRTNGNPDLVGRSALVMEDRPFAFASYLFRVQTNGRINSPTLVSFLNCKYGRIEIDKNSVKGNQTNFSPAKFRDIDIPEFNSSIQDVLKSVIEHAYYFRKEGISKYAEAESILYGKLRVRDIKQVCPVVAIKRLHTSLFMSGRLDAEYYQPKYDSLCSILNKHKCLPLGGEDGITCMMKSIEPGSNVYQDNGIPFVRVSDISKYGISKPEIYIPKDIIPNAWRLFPKKDTILFSKDGSIGIAYKVEEDSNFITSGALLHLRVRDLKQVLPDYLTLVLNSPVVQLQAERDSNGAIIQHWKPSEIGFAFRSSLPRTAAHSSAILPGGNPS